MTTIGSAGVGTRGTLIIDDDGTYIRLYLSQGDPATYINPPGKPWSVSFSGIGNDGGNFTWGSGGGTRLIAGPYYVGYTQNIAFSIGATGTQGFGNTGATAYATAYRATVPGTPGTPVASEVTPTSMRLSWAIPGNGGAGIDQMLLRRSPAVALGSYTDYPLPGNATTHVVTGLDPATTYYWRVYAHNTVGYSSQSGVIAQMTASGAYASINGVWVPVPINVSNGAAWNALAPLVSDGSVWEAAI